MWDKLLAQWKSSPILRYGAVGIVVVLILNGILDLQQATQAQVGRQQQLASQIAKSQRYANDQGWPARAEKANLTQVQLESRLWRSPSAGLAQATFHDWLTGTIKKCALTKTQVEITQDSRQNAKDPSELLQIHAKMSFELTPTALIGWLSEIEQHPKQVIIERLQIQRQPIARVEAQLIAPFRLDPTNPPAPNP
jgi:Type II secretion system (T2SS), protein M subtype b